MKAAEKARAYNAEYRKRNTDKQLAQTAKWRAENPESARAITRNRRARIKQSSGHHSAADIVTLFRLQKGRCANCKENTKKKFHVDHIVPLALGGSNGRENLQILCPPCNRKKGAMHPIVFAQREGRLL